MKRAVDARRLDFVYLNAEVQVDIRLLLHKFATLSVLIMSRFTRVSAAVRPHKVRQVPQIRIRKLVDVAVEVHANFRTAVPP